ncbi:MAG: xanthine dehydrogenase family protein molybdopterin-binding subunit [Myxococcota bacterium]
MQDKPLANNQGWIGQSPARVDGPAKVAGTAAYIADMSFPNAIDAAVVRSTIPRGRILGIDFDPDFDWSDVTIVTAKDIPCNEIAEIKCDQPALADDQIRHVYEPIVLLACPDRAKLARAVHRVTVRVEELPPLLDMDDAVACKELVLGDDNVMCGYRVKLGNAPAEIEKSEVVVRGTYSVGHQEQMYIEPQGCVAYWDDDRLRVVGSMQCPYYVEKALAHALKIDPARIDVTQSVTGGAFGGKEEYPSVLAVHVALLSQKAGRPVRLIYDRKEDVEVTTKRHPARVSIVAGCSRDGTLNGVHVDILMDAGAYVTMTPVVLSRGVLHACGAYRWKSALLESKAVVTNTPPNGAFRGFGAPQTLFALERHMDRLAEAIGMEPMELRRKNLLGIGSTMPTGQVLTGSVGVEECVRRAVESSAYEHKRKTLGVANLENGARKVRGIGASVFLHGAGFTGSGEDRLKGVVELDLLRDGHIRVRASSTDIGQGTETVFRQIAAEGAKVRFDDVAFAIPSTAHVPDSGPTVASRTVMIVGSIVGAAARELRERVDAEIESGGGSFAEASNRLLEREGKLVVRKQYGHPPGVKFDDATYTGTAYPAYAWACDIAEVEVDLDTFEIDLVGFWSAVDVGRAIHPVMCRGQLDGGALQSIGWALCEEVQWKDGHIVNPRMTTYIVPTALDAPPFYTELVEEPYEHGPGGAKGIGELPMDGGAPAIAAAIEHATGVSFDRIPMTPERLFDAWVASNKEVRS